MAKKVLIINSAKNSGSTGVIAEQIGLVAQKAGWECAIASSSRYNKGGSIPWIKIGSKWSELLHTIVFSNGLDANGLGSILSTWRFLRKVKKFNPDVIHLHNVHGHYINYWLLFRFIKKHNIPLVWTLHDCWAFTGRCSYFEVSQCKGWLTGCNHCIEDIGYGFKHIVTHSKRNFKIKSSLFTGLSYVHITTVSDWLGALVKQSFLKEYPISTIYNGVNMGSFKPTGSNLREKLSLKNKFVLLAVSNVWNHVKGMPDYIELSTILPETYQLIMIGLTEEQLLKLPSNIIGIKRTDSQLELIQYYTMADIVLNLSYQETFGMTTIEGLACGTPSIVYNRTASPELITKETGRSVEPGDISIVMDAIADLKSYITEVGRNNIIEICRKRVAEYFNATDRYNDYVKLYESFEILPQKTYSQI